MSHSIQTKNWPPFPKIPQDALHHGITTRIMALRQHSQIRRDSDSSSDDSQRSIQFLTGTSIPNSTIRRSLLDQENKSQISVESKLSRSSKSSNKSILEEQADNSKTISESEERGLERIRQKIRKSTIQKALAFGNKKEQAKSNIKTFTIALPVPIRDKNLDPIRKIERIHPVSILACFLTTQRRSTVESIKKAIDKFPDYGTQLVNADSFERRSRAQHVKTVTPLEPVLEALNITKNFRPAQKRLVIKKDLQTQTSLLMEKVLVHMGHEK